nr:hypothetical protein CFP56_21913 [Quercus suber]
MEVCTAKRLQVPPPHRLTPPTLRIKQQACRLLRLESLQGTTSDTITPTPSIAHASGLNMIRCMYVLPLCTPDETFHSPL